MKTIYIFPEADLAFASWEDCMKFMKNFNAECDYNAINKNDFIELHFWEEGEEEE